MPSDQDAPHSSYEILAFYRQEIHFESDLVGRRVTALLSSQSFLVIAYGSTMVASIDIWEGAFAMILPPALAILGGIMTLLAWPGIRGAQAVLEHWEAREDDLLHRVPELAPFSLLSTPAGRQDLDRRRRAGTVFAKRAPAVLLGTWCLFAALPLMLRLVSA